MVHFHPPPPPKDTHSRTKLFPNPYPHLRANSVFPCSKAQNSISGSHFLAQKLLAALMPERLSPPCTVLSCSVVSDSLRLPGLSPARFLYPWGFSRHEHWSGWPFPSPGDLPNPGNEPSSPALQADSLPSEPPGKPSLLSLIQV